MNHFQKQNKTDTDSLHIWVDFVCVFFTFLLLGFAILFTSKVPHWKNVAIHLFLLGIFYMMITAAIQRIPSKKIMMIARIFFVTVFSGFLFDQMQYLQHMAINQMYRYLPVIPYVLFK